MNPFLASNPYGGMRIIETPHALETTQERLFPKSRYRSARIRKKLIKRHGGEFKQVPCIWQIGNEIHAHPNLYGRLTAELRDIS